MVVLGWGGGFRGTRPPPPDEGRNAGGGPVVTRRLPGHDGPVHDEVVPGPVARLDQKGPGRRTWTYVRSVTASAAGSPSSAPARKARAAPVGRAAPAGPSAR